MWFNIDMEQVEALRYAKHQRVIAGNTTPFHGEVGPKIQPWDRNRQESFASDLCRLLIACNIAWHAVELPYWQFFFQKWLPGCLIPGRLSLSGRILDEEATKVMDKVKMYVKGRFATGQCDAWKNIAKTSIVASMINVEYSVCNSLIL